MSVKPKLVCPPNYSILSLRFTECKKIGIVKGVSTLVSYDLSNFFIPLTDFSERRFTIKAGKTEQLDIGNIAVQTPLNEIYMFDASSIYVVPLTQHLISIYADEEHTVLLSSIAFTYTFPLPPLNTFRQSFQAVYDITPAFSSLVELIFGSTTSAAQFSLKARNTDTKYYYEMTYDTLAPVPYVTPGTLIQKSQNYPEGRVRAIFLMADFDRVDKNTCGCNCCHDPSGTLLSNIKNYKWSWDSEYQRKQPSAYLTKIYVNADASSLSQLTAGGTQTFQWTDPANTSTWVTRVPYNLEVGDLITLNDPTFPNPYAYVTNIDGYNITVDKTGFGAGLGASFYIIKKYSPSVIDWKVGGEMLFLSGGQDVYTSNPLDRLYTETIWINNTQNYDIPFTAIIIS